MRNTQRVGLPVDALQRLGTVICADESLESRLQNRKKTQLHPVHLRKVKDTLATRNWLASSAAAR
jgi:hypothetical protein